MSEEVLILAGPSGSGKSTIANELVAKHGYKRVRSATTRLRRPNEGHDEYEFVDLETFKRMRADGRLSLVGSFYNGFYGTLEDSIRNAGWNVPVHVVYANHIDAVMREWWNARVIFLTANRSTLAKRIMQRPASRGEREHRLFLVEEDLEHMRRLEDKPYSLGVVSTEGSIDEAVQDVTAKAGAAGLYPVRPMRRLMEMYEGECEMCGSMRPLACRTPCSTCGHVKDC